MCTTDSLDALAQSLARRAKAAARPLAAATTGQKNAALDAIARRLRELSREILDANARDLAAAQLQQQLEF